MGIIGKYFFLFNILFFFLNVEVAHGQRQYTIAEIKADVDGDQLPDKLGETVIVRGIVLVSPGTLNEKRTEIALHDSTGSIFVFGESAYVIDCYEGDKVLLKGEVNLYKGLTQLIKPIILSREEGFTEPQSPVYLENSNYEYYESQLVQVQGHVIKKSIKDDGLYLVLVPNNLNLHILTIYLSSNHSDISLFDRIDNGTELKVTGILIQYDSYVEQANDYQILPRTKSDVEIIHYSPVVYRNVLIAILTILFIILLFVFFLGRKLIFRTKELTYSKLALEKERQDYKYLFYRNPQPMLIYDLETLKFLAVNDAAVLAYGYSSAEFKLMIITDFSPKQYSAHFYERIKSANGNYCNAGVWKHVRKDGKVVDVEIVSNQIVFENRPAQMILINDVSEKVKAEKRLLESKQSLIEAQEIAKMGDWEFDLKCNVSKWSDNCFRLYGYSPNDFEPTYEKFRSMIHPDDLHFIDDGYTDLIKTKEPIDMEVRVRKSDHSYIWILNRIIPEFNNSELIKLKGVNINIDEKKRNELQLKFLSKAIEQSPVSIIITDTDGKVEYVNPNFSKVTGYSYHEIVGLNPRILNSGYHSQSFFAQMWDTILNGKTWTGEIYNKKKTGEYYWDNTIISPLFDHTGRVTNFVAAKEDVTEKKRLYTELIVAKERAEISDRLKTAFLSNMSHEIRTPLNAVVGFSEILVDEISRYGNDTYNRYFKIITEASERLIRTVNMMVSISLLQVGELPIMPVPINVDEMVDTLKAKYEPMARSYGLEFHVNKMNEKMLVVFDKYCLEEAITQLIENAIKFTETGSVTIDLTKDNSMRKISVSDTGRGISKAFKEKIFEYFSQEDGSFTRNKEGLGIGLSLANQLVSRNNGRIEIESELNKGSTFSIIF